MDAFEDLFFLKRLQPFDLNLSHIFARIAYSLQTGNYKDDLLYLIKFYRVEQVIFQYAH